MFVCVCVCVCVCVRERGGEIEGEGEGERGLVYLTAYQLFMGYLVLKFDSFVNVAF